MTTPTRGPQLRTLLEVMSASTLTLAGGGMMEGTLEHTGGSFSRSPSRINAARKRTTMLEKFLSMRFLLLVSFAIPVLGLAISSYTTATVSLQTTTSDLSSRILESIVYRVVEHSDLAFAYSWNLTKALSRELPRSSGAEIKQFLQYDTLRAALWKVWQNSNDNVVTVFFAGLDGSILGYYRNTDASPHTLEIHSNFTSMIAYFARVQDFETGWVNKSDPSIYVPPSALNMTNAAWWGDSSTAQSQIWTHTYYDETAQGVGVIWNTCSYPVKDPDTNETLAIMSVDLTSSSLRDYLRQIKISKHAQVWIMKKSGILVASSDMNERTYTGEAPPGLTYAQDSNLPIVRETSLLVLNNTNPLPSYKLSFKVKGDKVKAQVVVIQNHNFYASLVIAYPESDFLGEVHKTQAIILAISSVAIFVAIVFSLLAVWLITVPLTKLGKNMNEIARGSFDAALSLSNTNIYEIKQLQIDFRRMVNALRSFSRFVPVDIVRHLLRNNTEAIAGVVQRDTTVLFSDIVGFTHKVEVMSPEQLSMLLSDYLNAMCSIIGENSGTVDKFIGDAIMALWNVPSPVKNHSHLACETALQSVKVLDQLNMKWKLHNLPEIRCRIGIHTGRALVGNVGSLERLSFTAIGDNVNLASRLEGLNKKYNTSILVSGDVYDTVQNQYLCRFLDVVVVQGRTTPTRIYELVARVGEASAIQIQTCSDQAEAVSHFLNKNFATALEMLHHLQDTMPHDVSIRLLIERASKAMSDLNLPPEWTGHLVLDEK